MTSLVDYLQTKLADADKPEVKIVHPGMLVLGNIEVLLWPGEWRCRVCYETGPLGADSYKAAWDHVMSHVPPKRKWWWRR